MASSDAKRVAEEDKKIPEIIVDKMSSSGIKKYERRRFLGKGGFAKCFELKDLATGETMAGKIVPKHLLVKQHQRDKMAQEINVHKSLNHQYIVKLYSYFEDDDFVYIILELCKRRSMMELHKRRKALTEPETRYFMRQILLGCKYLHDNKIIHRDLKLGNIFLNDNMEIKIGDFGLATKIGYEGERKRTLCGTPNYIAPEVLGKKGHSYEVDIWSLGCILYTLLVGKPPFETPTLKDTYAKIRNNVYRIPAGIGPLAKYFITRLLQSDPSKRPTIDQMLNDDFMTTGYLPAGLPVSCLTMAPRFNAKPSQNLIAGRGPLLEINDGGRKEENPFEVKKMLDCYGGGSAVPKDFYISELHSQLKTVLRSKPSARVSLNEDESEDPKSSPIFWVTKWVDYSDKYGFGYSLCDDSIGVVFNDFTRLLLLSDGSNIHYIDYEGGEHYYTLSEFPPTIEKKVKLLNYFTNYMKEHLLKAGANMEVRECDDLSRIPSLKTWFRTTRAVVMHFSNGTLQINFFLDHTKIILCPLMGAVTYIDEHRKNRTLRFDLIEKHGCSEDLSSRLQYALEKIETIVECSKNKKISADIQQGKLSAAHTINQRQKQYIRQPSTGKSASSAGHV